MLEKTLESLLDSQQIKLVNPWENQPWIFLGMTDAKAEAPILDYLMLVTTHGKTPWFWERFRARREGGDRGWEGLMALLSRWTWVWANSGRWWRTGKPGVLLSTGLQRVRHDRQVNNKNNLYENITLYTLKRYIFWGVFCVASLVDRNLRSFHLGSWYFYQAPCNFDHFASNTSRYKSYSWLQHFVESFEFFHQVTETKGDFAIL